MQMGVKVRHGEIGICSGPYLQAMICAADAPCRPILPVMRGQVLTGLVYTNLECVNLWHGLVSVHINQTSKVI